MIQKYNLQTAIQKSNEIVHDGSWVQSLKDAEKDQLLIRQEISEVLNPITQQMMKAPAELLVDKMSDDFVNLISQTAIAFAQVEGVEGAKDEQRDSAVSCEPEIKYIPIKVEIERCTSSNSCLCPDPIITINECDIDWNEKGAFYNTNRKSNFEEPVYNYDYDTNIHGTAFYQPEEFDDDDFEFVDTDEDDIYWYDEGSWEYTDESGQTFTDEEIEQQIIDGLKKLQDYDYDSDNAFYDDSHQISEKVKETTMYSRLVDWWNAI